MPDDIKQYLQTLPTGDRVYFYPNVGNAGDSLIAEATFQLFRELGISYQVLDKNDLFDFDPVNKVVIYGGGGNLVPQYRHARLVVEQLHKFAKKFVILPHTIAGNKDLLRTLGTNVDIIARESVSYAHVKKHNLASNIMLMDDLALSLDVSDVLSQRPTGLLRAAYKKVCANNQQRPNTSYSGPSPSQILGNNKLELEVRLRFLFAQDGDRVLNCLRADAESTTIDLPKDNLDISSIFAYGTANEELVLCSSYRLLRFIKRHNRVRTNRLHVCIAAGLLGKTVELYPNNYWKCEAVYRQSLRHRFPNVRWCGGTAW